MYSASIYLSDVFCDDDDDGGGNGDDDDFVMLIHVHNDCKYKIVFWRFLFIWIVSIN